MSEYKSIKVKKETYEELKKMGKGISGAIETLVKSEQHAFVEKIEDIEQKGEEIAQILFDSGIFDIKFESAGIENVEIDDTMLIIKGYVNINIPSDDARERIYEVLARKEEEENGEQSE